jgi:dolichol-phosphate mannosyltransferase
MKLCLVMPAFNEADCIASVVQNWIKGVSELFASVSEDFRVIVVNDGSKDNTGHILDSLGRREKHLVVVHQKNGGHGKALLTAYEKALEFSPEWVFHVDSDDQFKPSDFKKIWDLRATSKFLMGCRVQRHDPLHRLIITRIMRSLVFLFFGAFLKDANIPFRLIRTDYLRKLLKALPSNVFAPNIFLSVLAAKDGQDLKFIPVTHEERKTGQVSIVKWGLIKVCIRSARELLFFRFSVGSRVKSL